MTTKDKIRAEIERRIEWLNTATGDFAEGRRAEMRSLYDFIDSLQQEQPEVFDTIAFQKGVAEGRRLEREDLLKDAFVDNYVVHDGRIELGGDPLPSLDPILIFPYPQFKPGDKVKIIIVKEEEQ